MFGIGLIFTVGAAAQETQQTVKISGVVVDSDNDTPLTDVIPFLIIYLPFVA